MTPTARMLSMGVEVVAVEAQKLALLAMAATLFSEQAEEAEVLESKSPTVARAVPGEHMM